MKLHSPFLIGSRLMPALRIGDGWLTLTGYARFVINLPDGSEHPITDYKPGLSASRNLQLQFADMLCFLAACAESRRYARAHHKDPMEGENSDLFSESVGDWAEQHVDEITMLQIEIEETENLIETED